MTGMSYESQTVRDDGQDRDRNIRLPIKHGCQKKNGRIEWNSMGGKNEILFDTTCDRIVILFIEQVQVGSS